MFDGTNWVPQGLLLKETGEYLRVEHKTEDVTVNTGAFKDKQGVYDLELVAPNAEVVRFLEGMVIISDEVTR